MAGKITNQTLERVREATNIVDVISGYVTLKRSGRNYKGLCPFHNEKTPSFSVTPDRGWFNCFGCGEKGSAIDFIMAIDRVTFPEAVEILAERAGIIVEREETPGFKPNPDESSKNDVFRVNRWAAEFFKRRLQADAGANCREYLANRGFSDATIEEFQVGYAPDGWTEMSQAAAKKGITEKLLLDAGLAKKREGKSGVYDAFRDRVIFPIFDALNRVIGFGGRCLDNSEPKYLNSPKTPVFNKSASLYALDRLKRLKAGDEIFVMEGYTDVIMAVQAADMPAVATLGTALTPQHARLLTRYTDRITLVYDGDSAGRKAAERGAELFTAVDLEVRVARLAGGADPCEFLLARGGEGRELIREGALPFFDFVLGEVEGRHDLSDVTGKVRAADELLKLAKSANNPIKRGLILDRIAESLSLVRGDLEARLQNAPVRRQPEEEEQRPKPKPVTAVPDRPVTTATRRAEKHVFQALINGAGVGVPWHEQLAEDDFSSGLARRLFAHLKVSREKGELPGCDQLLLGITDDQERGYFKEFVIPEESGEALVAQLTGAIRHLLARRHERELGALKAGGVNEDNFEAIVAKMRRKPAKKEAEKPPEPKPAISPPDPGPVPERTWEAPEVSWDESGADLGDDDDDMF